MRRLFSLLLLASVAVLFTTSLSLSHAQTFTVLHSFSTTGEDGQNPADTLLLANGKLYGTTLFGGLHSSNGTIFQMDLKGNEVVLYRFDGTNGSALEAGVVRDAAGNLYGTASGGGAYNLGTVFKLDPAGTLTVLHNFTGGTDGANPFAGVTLDGKGNLYGTAIYGGDLNCGGGSGCGTVFRVDGSGKFSVLYAFTGGNDGGIPYVGSLLLDSAGNLIGTTIGGGTYGQGTIFKVHPDGSETTLYSFTGGRDGGEPYSGLIVDGQGNLKGTTLEGGSAGIGTVFKLSATGQEKVLYTFSQPADGEGDYGRLLLDTKGNLYGTTTYGGTDGVGLVFEISPDGTETVLHNFVESTDGGIPVGGLVMDSQGNLYGTAQVGGAHGVGTVFKIAP